MASAQALPNSAAARKEELLEAGRRRLREFRKNKASAGQAKKAASTSQRQSANVEPNPHVLDNQHVRVTDSSAAGTSNGVSEAIVGDENRVAEVPLGSILGSNAATANSPMPTNYNNAFQVETTQANDRESDRPSSLYFTGTGNTNYGSQSEEENNFGISTGASRSQTDRSTTDESSAIRPQIMWGMDRYSSKSSQFGKDEALARKNDMHVKDLSMVGSLENSRSSSLQSKLGYTGPPVSGLASSIYEDSVDPHTRTTKPAFDIGQDIHSFARNDYTTAINKGEMDLSNSSSHFPSGNSTLPWPSESPATTYSFNSVNSSNHVPVYSALTESNTRRSRPSFLDSINVPRAPPVDQGRVNLSSSEVYGSKMATSTASDRLFTHTGKSQPYTSEANAHESSVVSSAPSGNGDALYIPSFHEDFMERKQDQYLHKQDENFAALEQHIEDLTQEKFSLQRTLEASRALAESLAAENSSLTDSYNQQGSLVNQLKSDMERLQEEIKAQRAELESFKTEYANAQLECNAADERSKLLASEVIGLEEKALRLRSSELKLERQLENANSEISLFRKKLSSLEKERQDLHSTIDALQEEKKLLQAKLRKSSANGKFVDASKNPSNKKDVSTSTEDLVDEEHTGVTADSSNLEIQSTTAHLLGSDASTSSLLPGTAQFNLDVDIPHDQMRTIQNINTIISELALEKEQMTQLLLVETSESSKLKELNKELSRKLEMQTQRLELLTAQNMASGSAPIKEPEARSIQDNTPYADEGDEVVERVLGWIMKLFPGGPSRRRPSKRL